MRKILNTAGVFASAAEAIDPTTPFGKFGLMIMFEMAEPKLDRTSANWRSPSARL